MSTCADCPEDTYGPKAKRCRTCADARVSVQMKACQSRRTRTYTDADKVGMKRWRQANFTKYLVGAARGRAKKKGIPFNITHEDISIPLVCPVLGIELTTAESRERKDNLATLDRIIPELGYVKGNVAVISWRANFLKCNGTIHELEAIVNWMKVAS